MLFITSAYACKGHDDVILAVDTAGYVFFNYRVVLQASPWEDLNISHDRAVFERDREKLQQCEALILVLPGGRGAHVEAGYVTGLGRPVIAVGQDRPELMYGLFTHHVRNTIELLYALEGLGLERQA